MLMDIVVYCSLLIVTVMFITSSIEDAETFNYCRMIYR